MHTAPHIIHLIVAARPNMMKIAPLYHALAQKPWAKPLIIHTGQHYDDNMSGAFLRDFDLPAPHHTLDVGSGTHAAQTGHTMMAYEALCLREKPAMTIVVGDVNATIACALAAKKLHIRVGHLEAGLRSFDRTMPEEINRLATDAICDFLWTPSPDATAQLLREGVDANMIREVGNIMIDSYCLAAPRIAADTTRSALGLGIHGYAVTTFHRPANVDNLDTLAQLVRNLQALAAHIPLVFPVHPRTRKQLEDHDLMASLAATPHIHLLDPLGYIPFMNLVTGARCVVTDSGGVQEETSYLGIPCFTLRATTERPITLTEGTNKLITFDNMVEAVTTSLAAPLPARPTIKCWDGQTATRVVAHIDTIMASTAPTQKTA